MTRWEGIDIDGRENRGKGREKPASEVEAYEQSVKKVLEEQIKRNAVGRIIVAAIQDTKKDLTIVPFDKGKAAALNSACNAAAEGNAADSQAEGHWVPVPGGKYDPTTGKGSSVRIYYTPGVATSCGGGVYGSLDDELLLHEMVHALRRMQGLQTPLATKDTATEKLGNYDTEEEFLAIVVANVYISAKGSTNLRADHRGYTQLWWPLDTSAGFLAEPGNRRLLEIYRLVWKPTFQQIANVSETEAVFNPFRELKNELAYLGSGPQPAPRVPKHIPWIRPR